LTRPRERGLCSTSLPQARQGTEAGFLGSLNRSPHLGEQNLRGLKPRDGGTMPPHPGHDRGTSLSAAGGDPSATPAVYTTRQQQPSIFSKPSGAANYPHPLAKLRAWTCGLVTATAGAGHTLPSGPGARDGHRRADSRDTKCPQSRRSGIAVDLTLPAPICTLATTAADCRARGFATTGKLSHENRPHSPEPGRD